MSYPRLTKRMPDETRHNPFHLLHKALRFGHCHMLLELGAQDFSDDAAAARLLLRLVQQLDLYRAVAEARQEALLATLATRGLDMASTTCEDHASHLTALAELESLVRAINVAAPQRRRLAGRSTYRCFALYVAADMERMDEDETVLLTTLHQALNEDDLRMIEARSFGDLAQDHLQLVTRLLLPALSTAEVEALLGVLRHHMKPDRHAGALDAIFRPLLAPGNTAAA